MFAQIHFLWKAIKHLCWKEANDGQHPCQHIAAWKVMSWELLLWQNSQLKLFNPKPSLLEVEVFLRPVPDNELYIECLSLLDLFFTQAWNPDFVPNIDGAPSVPPPTYIIPALGVSSSKYLVVVSRGEQKWSSSLKEPAWRHLANTNNWEQDATSVD